MRRKTSRTWQKLREKPKTENEVRVPDESEGLTVHEILHIYTTSEAGSLLRATTYLRDRDWKVVGAQKISHPCQNIAVEEQRRTTILYGGMIEGAAARRSTPISGEPPVPMGHVAEYQLHDRRDTYSTAR